MALRYYSPEVVKPSWRQSAKVTEEIGKEDAGWRPETVGEKEVGENEAITLRGAKVETWKRWIWIGLALPQIPGKRQQRPFFFPSPSTLIQG